MPNMQLLREQLVIDEGLRLKPYRDTVGKLTIGVGRNLDDVGISEAEAFLMLDNDARSAAMEARNAFPWYSGLPEPVQRGLVNMVFNMGLPRVRGFRKMLAAMEAGDFQTAAVEALDSKWARQVGARADRIAELFRSAENP